MPSLPSPGQLRNGFRYWEHRLEGVEVRFLGRGPELDRRQSLERVENDAPEVAQLQQIHSARVVEAMAGSCGEGDALVTQRPGLALSVITADCVPILVAGGSGELLAIHAGWRGVVEGVVASALKRVEHPAAARAWLGPAIGPCCYEVGNQVADAVVAAAGPAALAPRGARDRPHVDLHQAVLAQLMVAGLDRVERLELCTRCNPDLLWSYRRHGARSGRNIAYIWK